MWLKIPLSCLLLLSAHLNLMVFGENGGSRMILRHIHNDNYEDDEIKLLPGLPKSSFKQYSGYLYTNKSHTSWFNYWFVESQSNPSEDPIILWMNGEPASSSYYGLLVEIGPNLLQPSGQEFRENPHSWNTKANLLFLETPIGVGFSNQKPFKIVNNDETSMENNYAGLKSFYNKFYHRKNNNLYLAGESYAGVYLPSLGVKLLQDPSIQFSGIIIGNGFYNEQLALISRIINGAAHEAFDSKLYELIVDNCCAGSTPTRDKCKFNRPNDKCSKALFKLEVALKTTTNVNVYNYESDPKCQPGILSNSSSKRTCLSRDTLEGFFHRKHVADSLHAIHPNKWTLEPIYDNDFQYTQQLARREDGMKKEFLQLIGANKRILIYSGKLDIINDHTGTQSFLDDLKLKVLQPKSPWFVGSTIVGHKTYYEGLMFVTIENAGHMVPIDNPESVSRLLSEFIYQQE